MKKKYYIKLLSAVMSLVILCGLFSPSTASATSGDAYIKGLQNFFDAGNHAQLVNCPDAVYMEYAEQLRTNPVGSISMTVLGLIYGGFNALEKVEPNKDRYKEALLNIIRIYDEENAEIIGQQNLQNDTKEFKDYLHDVVDTEMDWLEAIGASDAMGPAASVALSVINEMAKDEEDLIKGISTLKTTLQNYEKHNAFLQLVAAQAEGELQLAATELSVGLSEVMKVRLLAYADLVKDSSEDYAKMFVCELFAEDFFNALEEVIDKHIGKITYFQAFQAVKLGVDIGKIAGNILISAEDVMSYVVEIKAVHDISIILENELNNIKNSFQKDNTKVTETDAQHYITYGNYLISSRVHGQYCMTAIYLQPAMQKWLKDSDVENAKALYNRLTTNLLDIKKNLDAICSGTSMTQVLSGIEADSIQYYNCSESGNFAVIEKNGKYGIIGYDGNLILPISYNNIYRGRGFSYDFLLIAENEDDWGSYIDKNGNIAYGYPDGGGVEPDAYWYNGQLTVFMPAEGIIGGIEELSWIDVEQRSWEKNAVLPIQEMSSIKQEAWGPMANVENSNFALVDTTTGKLVSDFIYSGFDTGNGFREGVLAVKKGNKWGFIDTKGNEITEFLYDPYEQNDDYEEAEYKYSIFTAANGYIAVLKDGKWGLIDIQGNTVVETSYDGISQVNPDGMFWLKENGTWSLYQMQK